MWGANPHPHRKIKLLKEEIKMKKIVCGCFGNIYYATILKDGLMSDVNRVDVTDDAIDAVFQHIISMDKFSKEWFAGYIIPKKKTDGNVCLCVFDMDKYELKKK